MIQDAVSDCCLKLASWRGKCSFSSWAYQTARNSIAHRFDREARSRTVPLGDLARTLSVPPDTSADLHRTVDRAMSGLYPVERLVVESAYWGGLSDREIAQFRGCNPTAVHKAHRRALRKMRVALGVSR